MGLWCHWSFFGGIRADVGDGEDRYGQSSGHFDDREPPHVFLPSLVQKVRVDVEDWLLSVNTGAKVAATAAVLVLVAEVAFPPNFRVFEKTW